MKRYNEMVSSDWKPQDTDWKVYVCFIINVPVLCASVLYHMVWDLKDLFFLLFPLFSLLSVTSGNIWI